MKKCEHIAILCKVVTENGAIQYKKICRICGFSMTGAIAHSILTEDEKNDAYKTTTEKLQEHRNKFFLEIYGKQQVKSNEWHGWYENIYLLSDEWADKRELVLDRDKHVCQGCLCRQATQVHHLSYKDVEINNAHEMLFDLISLCESCHTAIHQHKGGHTL